MFCQSEWWIPLELLNDNEPTVMGKQTLRESKSVQLSSSQVSEDVFNWHLWIDNKNGLIFSSSAIQISGAAQFPAIYAASCSIRILDANSIEVARMGLSPEKSGTLLVSSFNWDLKSRYRSYVKSGHYTISLVEQSSEGEIERCSIMCFVADTREILSTTDL